MTTETTQTLELQMYDFYTAIDISGSMGKNDVNGNTRIQACREAAEQHARVADSIDTDGGSVAFFNESVNIEHNVTASKMEEAFKKNSPTGGTNTSAAISALWNHHKNNSSKKFLLTVFTDGEPTSPGDPTKAKAEVENVIKSIANEITDKSQARIQFIQVGNDPDAKAWLEKLDSGLNAKFDIINYQTLDWLNKEGSESAMVQTVIDE